MAGNTEYGLSKLIGWGILLIGIFYLVFILKTDTTIRYIAFFALAIFFLGKLKGR